MTAAHVVLVVLVLVSPSVVNVIGEAPESSKRLLSNIERT